MATSVRRARLTAAGSAVLGFVLTFGGVRVLAVGYVRFLRDCLGHRLTPAWLARLMAAAYAAGAALTLDQFALWLNIRNVYWQRLGWESVIAVLMFAALLSIGIWVRRLFRAPAGPLLKLRASPLA